MSNNRNSKAKANKFFLKSIIDDLEESNIAKLRKSLTWAWKSVNSPTDSDRRWTNVQGGNDAVSLLTFGNL